jgi:hypothetical protein
LSRHLHQTEDNEQGLIIYPYAHLTESLAEHMSAYMRGSILGRFSVLSPERAVNLPASSNFEYVIGVGALDEGVVVRLRRVSYFFLRLHTDLPAAVSARGANQSTEDAQKRARLVIPHLYEAPRHTRRVSETLDWEETDSINYLKEYLLMHGKPLSRFEATERAVGLVGPSADWLVNGVAAHLRHKAGYRVV